MEKKKAHKISRPLEELVNEAIHHLKKMGYTQSTIDSYRWGWSQLIRFARDVVGQDRISRELIEDFTRHRNIQAYGTRIHDHRWQARRAVWALWAFASTGTIPRRFNADEKLTLPRSFQKAFDTYAQFCIEKADIQKSTMRDRRRHVRQLLHFLSDRRCKKLKDIKQALVSEFIATQGHLKPRTVSLVTCNVRSFLRYLYMEGIVIHDLSAHVPKVRIRRDEDIPNVWKQEDIERLHGSVDRSTVRGKRDYAILLLASRLGMRVGDIKRLRLEHIRWDEARIEMPQSKTGEPLLLPLTEEVGWALIDYLRNGRPDSAHREVFLGLQAPYAPFAPINGNLYHVVSHYREPEKIKGGQERGRGLHSLRHTMASNLLAEGVGLETIAGILGHRSLDTTRIYTKVDIRGLRSVALDPEEVGHV